LSDKVFLTKLLKDVVIIDELRQKRDKSDSGELDMTSKKSHNQKQDTSSKRVRMLTESEQQSLLAEMKEAALYIQKRLAKQGRVLKLG